MLRLPDGKVWLNEGETVPVFCECGHIYQPNSMYRIASLCPLCQRDNIHKANVTMVPFKDDD